MKTCQDCEQHLPLDAFSPRSGVKNRSRGTLQGRCRDCFRVYKASEYRRVGRARYYERTYGITLDDIAEILASQGGGCAVCGVTEPSGHNWCVDHDHSCCPDKSTSCGRCIRGVLCVKCNASIGALNDDPVLLLRAADYLLQAGVSRMPNAVQ